MIDIIVYFIYSVISLLISIVNVLSLIVNFVKTHIIVEGHAFFWKYWSLLIMSHGKQYFLRV